MTLPRLLLIADLATAGSRTTLLDKVEICLGAGVRLIQLRAPDLSPHDLWKLSVEAATLASAYGAKLVINDRADTAFAVAAAGVHLPASGLPVRAVRRIFEQGLVGVSCHTLNDCINAQDEGASYATLSPIWASQTKEGRVGQGLEWLAKISIHVDIPIYALSGVTPERVEKCLDAGAYGVAVMSGLLAQDDTYELARAYLEAIASAPQT